MVEEEKFYKQEVWESLNQAEKRICLILSLNSSWYKGIAADAMQAAWEDDSAGFNKDDIDELIERGIIEVRDSWEYAKEYVDGNRIGLQEIEIRRRQREDGRLSEMDAAFIKEFRAKEHIVENKIGGKSYRLTDDRFHNNVQMISFLGLH